jgi:hypothetical protein
VNRVLLTLTCSIAVFCSSFGASAKRLDFRSLPIWPAEPARERAPSSLKKTARVPGLYAWANKNGEGWISTVDVSSAVQHRNFDAC